MKAVQTGAIEAHWRHFPTDFPRTIGRALLPEGQAHLFQSHEMIAYDLLSSVYNSILSWAYCLPKQGVSNISRCALEDVKLDMRQGWFIWLIGPSGCGKSGLLQALARLVKQPVCSAYPHTLVPFFMTW